MCLLAPVCSMLLALLLMPAYLTWLLHTWHDSSICDMTQAYVTWLVHMWHYSGICHLTHACVTWLMHMWHVSFIRDTTHLFYNWHACLAPLCSIAAGVAADWCISEMTHAYVTWLMHVWHGSVMCDMTYLCMNDALAYTSVQVIHKWVMSHVNEPCHTCMSHVTYAWVMSHVNEPCHTCMSHVTYAWVMSHIHKSAATHGTWAATPGVTAHLWTCHLTCAYGTYTCDVYMWLDLCIYAVYATYMHTSSHMWRIHVTWLVHICRIFDVSAHVKSYVYDVYAHVYTAYMHKSSHMYTTSIHKLYAIEVWGGYDS